MDDEVPDIAGPQLTAGQVGRMYRRGPHLTSGQVGCMYVSRCGATPDRGSCVDLRS